VLCDIQERDRGGEEDEDKHQLETVLSIAEVQTAFQTVKSSF
jgi:hypothetical protein